MLREKVEQFFDLEDKVACVTGGSRGIGKEIAKVLAAKGTTVVVTSRNVDSCKEVVDEIASEGGKSIAIKCDISNLEDIRALFRQIKGEFGKVDILVNNAGISVTKPSMEITEQDFDSMFDVNIKGLFFASQEAANMMMNQQQGKIINISSAGGIRTFKRIAPYSASKAAVIHLTRSLASEWARYGILVNGIAPGLISTDINTEQIADERLYQKMVQMIPLRRLGQPSDIALMCLFLASDASNFMAGQTISIDGGVTSE